MTQDSAYFFYEQKVLAEDPSADALSFYTALYDTTALSGLTAGDYQTLLAADASFDIDAAAPVQREQGSTPGAPRRRRSRSSPTPSRTGPRARTPTRTTRTAGGSSRRPAATT